jgi:hypothetical protein
LGSGNDITKEHLKRTFFSAKKRKRKQIKGCVVKETLRDKQIKGKEIAIQ